ncbi:GntR family transcriptional regulator [Kitasatospora sp. LaBMicrA B282]|uniref:GntR family transcriptional regulator n=1 Tax=Kitasatospora sp. LaBMicrA B282 TaxID=3420949 RepID=UPI003D0AD2DC
MSGLGRLPIQRNSLREQIAGALREELMAGRLAAGANFTVKEIAELYGVSATPAREALVDLAAQGLLRAEHHRGFTVPELGWSDFLEIFEARVMLTDSGFRRLATQPSRYDWSRLSSLRRRAEAAARAARAGQLDVMVGCDRRFWNELSAFLDNQRIADYLDWLRVQSWMFAARYLRAQERLAGVCWDRQGELVEQIAARDLAGAHRTVNQYNLFTVRLLADLTGESLDSVAVLPLLLAEPTWTAPAPPGEPPADRPQPADRPGPAAEPAARPEPTEAQATELPAPRDSRAR